MQKTIIEIDGSHGEGGGQIIRSSLALSAITGQPFKIHKIRAGRPKPGLQAQHLASVNAAAEVCSAEMTGASLGSTELHFAPGELKSGDFHFKIGTAGSTMLVLQTVLPPLLMAAGPSRLIIEGGTHNTHAPPFDFVKNTFVPLLHKMGPVISLELEKYGFYPPGGGRIAVEISPPTGLQPLHLERRGTITGMTIRILLVNLPKDIAKREIATLKEKVKSLRDAAQEADVSDNALSPGNVVFVEIHSEHMMETISSIGERGLRAEVVAERAAEEVVRYLQVDAAVGEHLADQLLLPMALAGAGSFITGEVSLHTKTNINVVQTFLPVQFKTEKLEKGLYRISVGT